MKIIVTVLLIAALGVGIYFYINKKQSGHSSNTKELILGTWKIDSLVAKDSSDLLSKLPGGLVRISDTSLNKYEIEFRKDSLILQTLKGKTEDTSHYEFLDENALLIWSNSDTAKEKYTLNNMDASKFIMLGKDSARFFFKKIK